MEVELVPIEWLRAHEEVRWKKVQELHDVTLKWGCYTKPLLVDSVSGAILDGHHRYQVGLKMELTHLPAIQVDYLNDDIVEVGVWPECGFDSISKQEIVEMALSDELYPPKTSRHQLQADLPPIHISLKTLGKKE